LDRSLFVLAHLVLHVFVDRCPQRMSEQPKLLLCTPQ
jgi:hypothetical protein